MIQGGDTTQGTGRGGESIYGAPFEDEKLDTEIDAPGCVFGLDQILPSELTGACTFFQIACHGQ